MTIAVGILVFIILLVLYSNDIGGKDCILILNMTVNSAWSAKEQRLYLQHHWNYCSLF